MKKNSKQYSDKTISNGKPLEIDDKRPIKIKMAVPKTKKGKKNLIMFIL